MKNWKTTVSGLIAAVGAALPQLGVPQEVATAVMTIGLFLIGLFSKDMDVTGGKRTQ